MIRARRANERGHFDHGWLDTFHTFSFGRYIDRSQMGFRALRVINEDRIGAGTGFGEHPHENMEILTYVMEGELAHRDSMGHVETIRPGEMQRMTAGTGITHSEFNPSGTAPTHLYQVWIEPEREGLEPSYEQRAFPFSARRNRVQLVASPDGRDGSMRIRQDATVSLAALDAGASLAEPLGPSRHAWVQVLRGRLTVNGEPVAAGDGASISGEPELALTAGPGEDAEAMIFDLA